MQLVYYEKSQYSELMSGRSTEQVGLQAFLAAGHGTVILDGASKNHHLVIAQRNQVPPTFFIPKDPMAAQVSYVQSQPNYGKFPWFPRTYDTKQATYRENVTVKTR